MINYQTKSAANPDIIATLAAAGVSACPDELRTAARHLRRGGQVALKVVGNRAVWIPSGGKTACDELTRASKVEGAGKAASVPTDAPGGEIRFALFELAFAVYKKRKGSKVHPVAWRDEAGTRHAAGPAKAGKKAGKKAAKKAAKKASKKASKKGRKKAAKKASKKAARRTGRAAPRMPDRETLEIAAQAAVFDAIAEIEPSLKLPDVPPATWSPANKAEEEAFELVVQEVAKEIQKPAKKAAKRSPKAKKVDGAIDLILASLAGPSPSEYREQSGLWPDAPERPAGKRSRIANACNLAIRAIQGADEHLGRTIVETLAEAVAEIESELDGSKNEITEDDNEWIDDLLSVATAPGVERSILDLIAQDYADVDDEKEYRKVIKHFRESWRDSVRALHFFARIDYRAMPREENGKARRVPRRGNAPKKRGERVKNCAVCVNPARKPARKSRASKRG